MLLGYPWSVPSMPRLDILVVPRLVPWSFYRLVPSARAAGGEPCMKVSGAVTLPVVWQTFGRTVATHVMALLCNCNSRPMIQRCKGG